MDPSQERCDMRSSSPHNSSSGFTLVEVAIIAPIVIIAISTIVTVIINLTGDVLASRAQSDMLYETQSALNQIEKDIKITGRFLAENNITIASPQGSNNGTDTFKNINSSYGTLLILKSLTTDTNESIFVTNSQNGTDNQTQLIYKNSPNACGGQYKTLNEPYFSNVVYFISNGSLWRRTILDAASTPCQTPWQKPTCASSVNGTTCKALDSKLLSNVSSFSIEYYANPGDTNPINISETNNALRQAAMNPALAAKVTITTTQSVATEQISVNLSLRAARTQTY